MGKGVGRIVGVHVKVLLDPWEDFVIMAGDAEALARRCPPHLDAGTGFDYSPGVADGRSGALLHASCFLWHILAFPL